MVAKKKPAASVKSIDVPLTSGELEMLRDIFGVIMPILVDEEGKMGEACVAEYVATVTRRTKLERTLWKKIANACSKLGIATGAEAPTFAVSAAHVPAMHVYKLED